MKRYLASLLIAVALGADAGERGEGNSDPVVLTLRSGEVELRMELGLIEKVTVLTHAAGYALNVSFSPEGLRYYKQFRSRRNGAPVELRICREQLRVADANVDMTDGAITIGGLKGRDEAEVMADGLWYGASCTRRNSGD